MSGFIRVHFRGGRRGDDKGQSAPTSIEQIEPSGQCGKNIVFDHIDEKEVVFMSITFGGIVLTALVVAVLVIGAKVKNNSEMILKLYESKETE